MALVDDEISSTSERLKFKSLIVNAGTQGPQSAELEMEVDGEIMKNKSTGDGPVDAIFNCIKSIFPHDITTIIPSSNSNRGNGCTSRS